MHLRILILFFAAIAVAASAAYIAGWNKKSKPSIAYILFAGFHLVWTALAISQLLNGTNLIINIFTSEIAWIISGQLLLNLIFCLLNRKRHTLFWGLLAVSGTALLLRIVDIIQIQAQPLEVNYAYHHIYLKPLLTTFIILPYAVGIGLYLRALIMNQVKNHITIVLFTGATISALAVVSLKMFLEFSYQFELTCLLANGSVLFLFFMILNEWRQYLYLENIAYDLFNTVIDGMLIIDNLGKIHLSNKAATHLFPNRKLDGTLVSLLFKDYNPSSYFEEFETTTLDSKYVSISQTPIRHNGKMLGRFITIKDLSKRQQLKREIIKRQRLESLGVIASGVAHDFNNTLTTITSNLAIVKMDMKNEDHDIIESIQEAENAAHDATILTKQLLSFTKNQANNSNIIDIQNLLRETISFTLRGSNIYIQFNIPDDLHHINGDQSQLSQLLSNIAINAKEAMIEGGTFIVQAENFYQPSAQHPFLNVGHYIKISCTDTGTGINPDDLPHIFDPYYSTKEKSNGLGLASSFSIVQSHNGHIEVDSTPGEGTSFTVYLPAKVQETTAHTSDSQSEIKKVKGNIMVVDDDESIRRTTLRVLQKYGYTTFEAKDGDEAISLYQTQRNQQDPIDLIIMDLTIPGGMGGTEALKHLMKLDPKVKALVSTGYTTDPIMSNYEQFGFKGVVEKPFKINEFYDEIQRVLTA